MHTRQIIQATNNQHNDGHPEKHHDWNKNGSLLWSGGEDSDDIIDKWSQKQKYERTKVSFFVDTLCFLGLVIQLLVIQPNDDDEQNWSYDRYQEPCTDPVPGIRDKKTLGAIYHWSLLKNNTFRIEYGEEYYGDKPGDGQEDEDHL